MECTAPERSRTALITGAAGFIGSWLAHLLLDEGWRVFGIDSMNAYYDPALKDARLSRLQARSGFQMVRAEVEDWDALERLWTKAAPDAVIHLAAQAGVRYSLEDPRAYLHANLEGAFNVLECARLHGCGHLLMASTSSVYGANTDMPYRETDKVDTPMSFYAATKKANEAMAHSYAHLYDIPITMFRFFTVYGPWGRPDMAYFSFTEAILNGQPIEVYNHGRMKRDFTYVGDLVEGIRGLIDAVPKRPDDGTVPKGDSLSPVAPHRVVNIGNADPVALGDFISAIEEATGCTAQKIMKDMQPGDVPGTWADTGLLKRLTGVQPQTDIRTGIAAFVAWYRDYYKVNFKG